MIIEPCLSQSSWKLDSPNGAESECDILYGIHYADKTTIIPTKIMAKAYDIIHLSHEGMIVPGIFISDCNDKPHLVLIGDSLFRLFGLIFFWLQGHQQPIYRKFLLKIVF